ncbi:MAG: N4-gp56 family major capsid protein [Oscillospiraceae bacterium]|jgi:N4-gp56 family major capsid protein|nr:N4-gp56 family major capsid protein [Oscillospiraceae bacterium]
MKKFKDMVLFPVLWLFDNTNVTTDPGLSDEMKIYYSDYLIDLAEPLLVHDQFGQKRPIPQDKGKIIEFRKYSPLPKMLVPLQEGVTPSGQKLVMSILRAEVSQYGGYIELSDILLLTAIDDNLVQATRLLGSQAGRTLDTITREVLNGGTNVQYGSKGKTARYQLLGGDGDPTLDDYLDVPAIKRAVRTLKSMNAPRINGSYVAIIHPDCTFDFWSDKNWVDVKTYSDPEGIYEGELGRMYGVRFVETTEAKVFHAEDLSAQQRVLSSSALSTSSATFGVQQSLTADDQAKIVGRKILIAGAQYTVQSATATTITVDRPVGVLGAATPVYPGEAGFGGRDIYSTLVLGSDAYGVTELSGGGLQHIIKQLGSGGTTDPLNQRATAGWKATKTAERLVEEYMVRIETTSTFEIGAN